MSNELVRNWYATHAKEEWERMFESRYTRLEFDTTIHFLDKYLPRKGRILDAGCGPGRYAIVLSKKDYDLTLFDLVSENLEFAKRKLQKADGLGRVNSFVKGSVEDLSAFPDVSFDAVLCLGPLSHLMTTRQRNRAVSELVRVSKVGAPIFVSVINKFSMLLYELMGQYALKSRPDGPAIFRRMLQKGDYLGEYMFTAFHGFLPEELREEFTRPGIRILEMAGLEGLGAHHEVKVNRMAASKKYWKSWLEAHYATCTHPAVQAMSEHALLIARKTGNSS